MITPETDRACAEYTRYMTLRVIGLRRFYAEGWTVKNLAHYYKLPVWMVRNLVEGVEVEQ